MRLSCEAFYRYAYSLLEEVTPLPADCGQLCGAACCKGDDETGMYLFPGERVMYRVMPDVYKRQVPHNSTAPYRMDADFVFIPAAPLGMTIQHVLEFHRKAVAYCVGDGQRRSCLLYTSRCV